MDFRIDVVTGIVIGASLWLVTTGDGNKGKACITLADIFGPCGCTLSEETFDLICASDGNTYLNTCSFDCQKILGNVTISVVHKGVCTEESQCNCQSGYAPVCASNGVTYPNECVLDCFMKKDTTIQLEHTGECDNGEIQGCTNQPQGCSLTGTEETPKNKKCVCAMNNRPVCGNNNHTYANVCVLHCIAKRNPSVEFQHWGVCGKPPKTPWGL